MSACVIGEKDALAATREKPNKVLEKDLKCDIFLTQFRVMFLLLGIYSVF